MKSFKSCLAVLAALLAISGCRGKEETGKAVIGLNQTSTYDFPAETSSDYPAKTPLAVIVTNTGSVATGKVTISIDGASSNSFSLSKTSIENIAGGGSDTFTVVPVQGLEEGDYKATVHVSAKGVAEQSFGVRFVVTEMNITSISIESPATKTVYGVGEPIDLTGLVVKATDSDGNTFTLENVEDYLIYDFSSPSEKTTEEPIVIIPTKVQIAVGAAPVKEFEVTILSLVDRFKNALGTTATIVVYSNEITEDVIAITAKSVEAVVSPTDITLTTPEGSTTERILKKGIRSYFFTINGNGDVKLTLDGYVTIKGWATQEFGGSDEQNNTNPLITMSNNAVLEMKGHSKLTGNCVYKNDASAWTDGAAVKMSSGAKWIIGGNSQVTNNGFVSAQNGAIYGGACYFTGAGTTVTIRDNARISGNFVKSAGNCLGGAFGGESNSVLYMEGGEVSGNYVISTGGAANAGAFCLVNATVKAYFSGGTVKDNYLLFKTAYRGSAILAGSAQTITLSGSINMPAGTADIVTEGDLSKDAGNAISLCTPGTSATDVANLNIEGTLTTASKIMLDINYDTNNNTGLANLNADTRIMRKRTIVDGAEQTEDFVADAPADKFMLRSYVNYRGGSAVSIADKTINANGYMITLP